MSSNLKVNSILPSTGTNVAIGTAGGTVTMVGNVDIDINSGISTFNDIHISDKIVHDGDTNTSIRFPSSDTITFETNGSERLRIDSSGRLLLGTTTEGVANASEFTIADTGHCGMTIRSGTSHDGQIAFSDGTSGNDEFRGQIRYNHADNYLTLVTDATERLRITSNGNILVGKTADAGKGVEIYQNANAALRIQNSSTGQGAGDGLLIETSGSDALIWNYENAAIRFGTNNGERVRIDSSGRVLINTTTTYPSNQMLYVKGGSPSTVYDGQAYLEGSETSGAINTGGTLVFWWT